MLLRARCETNTPEVGAKALVHEALCVYLLRSVLCLQACCQAVLSELSSLGGDLLPQQVSVATVQGVSQAAQAPVSL